MFDTQHLLLLLLAEDRQLMLASQGRHLISIEQADGGKFG
jgi:hypothetical protein